MITGLELFAVVSFCALWVGLTFKTVEWFCDLIRGEIIAHVLYLAIFGVAFPVGVILETLDALGMRCTP